MAGYIYQKAGWPNFTWQPETFSKLLSEVHQRQGKLMGLMHGVGFNVQAEASLATLTTDILKSSEIEGEILNADQVRSSIARRLGMDIAGLVATDRNVDGVVEMMLDATQNFKEPLSEKRLFDWHQSLFPSGTTGIHKMVVGSWRDNKDTDPMQVVSGPLGRQTVHFQAPDADLLPDEMGAFLKWFNAEEKTDPVIKAGIAHLWFVTIHPFDDGNGRIARAITDMLLARSDNSEKRFYSMSAQIRKQRNAYYAILEETQKNSLDITQWLQWFLHCLNNALEETDQTLAFVFNKARFWEKHANTQLNSRQKLMLNKLMDGFVGKLNSSKWAKITKSSSDTALRDITDLLQKQILVKEEGGGRSTSYLLNI